MNKKFLFAVTVLLTFGMVFFSCDNGTTSGTTSTKGTPTVLKAVGNGAIVYNLSFPQGSGAGKSARAASHNDGDKYVLVKILPNGKEQIVTGNITSAQIKNTGNGVRYEYRLAETSSGDKITLTTDDKDQLDHIVFDNDTDHHSGPLIPIGNTFNLEGLWKEERTDGVISTCTFNGNTISVTVVGAYTVGPIAYPEYDRFLRIKGKVTNITDKKARFNINIIAETGKPDYKDYMWLSDDWATTNDSTAYFELKLSDDGNILTVTSKDAAGNILPGQNGLQYRRMRTK